VRDRPDGAHCAWAGVLPLAWRGAPCVSCRSTVWRLLSWSA
jgi:hypothetical protein